MTDSSENGDEAWGSQNQGMSWQVE